MDNITDYVRWYGSLDFDDRPFTRVDNIVLSQLSYLDLKDIPELYEEHGAMTLKDAVNYLTNQGISIRKMAPDDVVRIAAHRRILFQGSLGRIHAHWQESGGRAEGEGVIRIDRYLVDVHNGFMTVDFLFFAGEGKNRQDRNDKNGKKSLHNCY